MSSSKKPRPPREPHRSDLATRQVEPPPEPPSSLDDPGLPDWSALGTELSARGQHRLLLALRVARAAATGGVGVSTEEEEQLAAWFAGIVHTAISRGGEHAGAAIWCALMGDFLRTPDHSRPARCPSIGAIPWCLGFPDFLGSLQAAAPGYMRTAIAGAGADEVDTLRALARANEQALDEFRPWGIRLVDDHPSHEDLELARAALTRRHLSNVAACGGFEAWANGSSNAAAEHDIPPVLRIGAIAWLAKVALREDGLPERNPAHPRRVTLPRRYETAGDFDRAGHGESSPHEEQAA